LRIINHSFASENRSHRISHSKKGAVRRYHLQIFTSQFNYLGKLALQRQDFLVCVKSSLEVMTIILDSKEMQ